MKIGLALGGGASRGLAHITMLEAFDELGIKPSIAVGCSIGALVGAGYAGGMSALEIREHTLSLLSNRIGMMKHVFGARKTKLREIISMGGIKSMQLEGRTLAEVFLPKNMPQNIETCPIALRIIATDYELQEEVVFKTGSIIDAVGASIAIPGIIAGPRINGNLHVDGGVKNPVPFDHARENSDLVVAIDVTGKPRLIERRRPSNFELGLGAMLIAFGELAELRRRANPPEIYIRPQVENFGAADFFKAKDILKAAIPAKEELKRALDLRYRP